MMVLRWYKRYLRIGIASQSASPSHPLILSFNSKFDFTWETLVNHHFYITKLGTWKNYSHRIFHIYILRAFFASNIFSRKLSGIMFFHPTTKDHRPTKTNSMLYPFLISIKEKKKKKHQPKLLHFVNAGAGLEVLVGCPTYYKFLHNVIISVSVVHVVWHCRTHITENVALGGKRSNSYSFNAEWPQESRNFQKEITDKLLKIESNHR